MRWTPLLTIAALVLAGCAASDDDPTTSSSTSATSTSTTASRSVPTSATATNTTTSATTTTTTSATVTATMTTTTTPTNTTAKPAPIVFTGTVVVHDPWAVGLDGCLLQTGMNDAGGPGDVFGNRHVLDPTLAGWTFAFANTGTLAEFWTDEPAILGSGASGTVPEGATYLNVCGNDPTQPAVEYTLTLTAP